MTQRTLPIAPRVLVPILQGVPADVIPGVPAGLTLADLDAEVSASLAPSVAFKMRRAVANRVLENWDRLPAIKPFVDAPDDVTLAELGLPFRSYQALSRVKVQPWRDATLQDLRQANGFGPVVFVEALAAYEAFQTEMGLAPEDGDPAALAQAYEAAAAGFEPETESSGERRVPQRVVAMRELYETGATLEEVGERFGVTRERVRQLFMTYGVPVRSVGETHELRRRQLMEARRSEICALLDAGLSPSEISSRLALAPQVVRDVLAEEPSRSRQVAFRRHARMKRTKPRYTDEEIVECLRTANLELGGVLTTSDYTAFAKTRTFPDGRPWPGHQTPFHRFGSWREALHQAGLVANPPSAVAGQRLFTRGHCIDAILEVERALGHPPTAAEYERAAVASKGALPSLATLRHRCGGWQKALATAARFSE